MKQLPDHLKKYIATQNYDNYTPIDHALWRYILRQLKTFLAVHGHECYLEGLEKTGIEIESIPKIEVVSKKLEAFGWRALPVSGFIPPAAFMELQSLGVLPVACNMRSMENVQYTPAPDIVHEAAGHAPILIHPEFADYLREYSQIAKKAIISKEDLDIYEAIRDLSDKKENPSSTNEDIQLSEKHLQDVIKKVSHVSEATELSRMNWWTAEYGLIGSLSQPKIFGAGLLSSVGESHWCLSDNVKKIPISIDCIKQTYDITEPQPQLYVTPSFQRLKEVLHEMAGLMAFKVGGSYGLDKALLAKTVTTVQLNSGLQISGEVENYLESTDQIVYFKTKGPTQICYQDHEIDGHNKNYHANGYSTILGFLTEFPNLESSNLSLADLKSLGLIANSKVELQWTHGAKLSGVFKSFVQINDKILILSFEQATVKLHDGTVVFQPDWGTYDLALGSTVTSVFGGPADRVAFGETDDFIAARVPAPAYDQKTVHLHSLYKTIREVREKRTSNQELIKAVQSIYTSYHQAYSEDWLLRIEMLELLSNRIDESYKDSIFHDLITKLKNDLNKISQISKEKSSIVQDGLALINQL